MSEIDKDEAERQKREAEQAAAAASARAAQAEAEVSRLRAIVEGIAALPTRANDIMAALQTARVQVETDAHQVSAVLADLKAAKDKAAAISNECRGFEAACKESAGKAREAAEAAKLAAGDAKGRAEVAERLVDKAKADIDAICDLRAKAQESAGAICDLRVKAERDAKSERTKSWLGLILAALALVGVVILFVSHASQAPVDNTQASANKPAAVEKAPIAAEKPQVPVTEPPLAPSTPVTPTSPVDKDKYLKYCLGNGLTSDECEAAWKRYTE